jgi:hypothetical protein
MQYPDCFKIVEEKIRPERQRRKDNGDYALRKPLPQKWWIYADKRPALYSTIAGMERVLVKTLVSNTFAFGYVSAQQVFAHKLAVFPISSSAWIVTIQSVFHALWSERYSSTLGAGLNYSPSDVFETFPFPADCTNLDSIGQRYFEHRQEIMGRRGEGLTKTYNRFHNAKEDAEDIRKLRELHVEMDHAVAKAYGWEDLDLGHGFHETKQGVRYTLHEEARREVLDRLLALNHERYEEEVKAGLHEKKGKKGRTKGGSRDGKRSPQVPTHPASLTMRRKSLNLPPP